MNSFEPRITVASIVEQDNRFLFVRESIHGQAPVLNQPAGHVEAGESLIQAVFRETLEETAWQVKVQSLIGIYVFQPNINGPVYYRFCFEAKALSHDPKLKLDKGIIEACWLTPEELANCPEQHRSPLVQRCLNDYLNGQRLPLDMIYQHPWPLQNR